MIFANHANFISISRNKMFAFFVRIVLALNNLIG